MNNQNLYELIQQNQALEYIDARNNSSFFLKDFHQSLAIPSGRELTFLYITNQIESVEVLLNFLNSQHVLVLLSAKLNLSYKSELEQLYKPEYIYDPERLAIEKHSFIPLNTKLHLFHRTLKESYRIHPSIRILLSTSGSTGSPKFVKLSEENLVQNALSILDYLPIQASDVTPLNLPLHYSYGLSVFTTNSIAGGKIICSDKDIMQKEFWEDWEKYQYTSLAGVPYVYETLLKLGFLKKQHPSLRYLTQAGGKLNKSILEQFATFAEQNNIFFYTMYGQTEATARMSFLAPEMLCQKSGSIGQPIKNGSFSLDNRTGELLYSGPNVFGGYSSDYSELAGYKSPDTLATGDIARKDDDGYYYITGRIKRMIKLFGNRINLDEVEHLLKSRFSDTSFVCLGLEDKYFFIAKNGNCVDEQSIKHFLFSELKINKNVIKIQTLDSVPLTANGKTDYQMVLEAVK